jgi:hypothetical protein
MTSWGSTNVWLKLDAKLQTKQLWNCGFSFFNTFYMFHWANFPCKVLRASPMVLSMRLQTIKFIAKNSKCTGLAQEIGSSAPNSCSLPWLIKGPTVYTSQKECNKLHLAAAQYFWLVDHNDWSRWFAISSPPCICSLSFIGGVAKRKS